MLSHSPCQPRPHIKPRSVVLLCTSGRLCYPSVPFHVQPAPMALSKTLQGMDDPWAHWFKYCHAPRKSLSRVIVSSKHRIYWKMSVEKYKYPQGKLLRNEYIVLVYCFEDLDWLNRSKQSAISHIVNIHYTFLNSKHEMHCLPAICICCRCKHNKGEDESESIVGVLLCPHCRTDSKWKKMLTSLIFKDPRKSTRSIIVWNDVCQGGMSTPGSLSSATLHSCSCLYTPPCFLLYVNSCR